MEYLLTAEELRKLEKRKKELESEELNISSEIEHYARENENYLESHVYERLRKRLIHEIPSEKERLREKIASAKVVYDDEISFDGQTVSVGAKVTLDYDGDEETFSILPVSESRFDENIISCDAPIVEHIIGKKKGDIVIFNGITVKIMEIQKA